MDEAFLDVTGSRKALGDGVTIARQLKAAIREATQLTAPVGVSTCKLVAKIASDLRKPDGRAGPPVRLTARRAEEARGALLGAAPGRGPTSSTNVERGFLDFERVDAARR